MPCIDLGPSHTVFWQRCVLAREPGGEPAPFAVALAASAAAGVITLCITLCHLQRFRGAGLSKQREYYERLVWMPLIFAVSSTLTLVTPRTWLLWECLQKSYEAFALLSFGRLLLLLVVQETTSVSGRGLEWPADEAPVVMQAPSEVFYSPLNGGPHRETVAEAVVKALRRAGPRRTFATPPVLWLCAPLMRPHLLSLRDLRLIQWSLLQYVIAVPALNVVRLWALLALPEPGDPLESGAPDVTGARFQQGCSWAMRLSALVALQGLFAMYRTSHDTLHRWSTTMKFVALKLVLFLDMLQVPLLARALDGTRECELRGEGLVQFWAMFLLSLEAALMAALLFMAYPAEELQRASREHRNINAVDLAHAMKNAPHL